LRVASSLGSGEGGLVDGSLRCDCYEYPVAGGIAVLRQLGPVSSTRNDAVEHIRRGEPERAVQWLAANGRATGVPLAEASLGLRARLARILGVREEAARPSFDSTGTFRAALSASRPSGYAEYLFHRMANPSLLAAIPPLIVLAEACGPGGRVLDLLCGAAHSSALLSQLGPGNEIVLADSDFVNLQLAKAFMAPEAVAVCIDADLPLPFASSSFAGIFCLDGLHYVRAKTSLLREVDRVVSARGAWVFAHMHNADVGNVSPGAPLSARGYAERFDFGTSRLLPEGEILTQFLAAGSLDLATQIDASVLQASNALTLIGSRDDRLWRVHANLEDAFERRTDRLGFNPLYRASRSGEGVHLEAAWPSESLRLECQVREPLVPGSLEIPRETLQEIVAARASGRLSPAVRSLLRRFVLVSLPACYERTEV
jgi:SAM-dependent methyltransferase